MAAIGSHNLDSRSCRLNFEASALIFDAGFAREVGDAECGEAGLSRTQQLARTTQLQVFFGDDESVIGLAHQRKSSLGGV